jgi:hypothetical protein
MNLLFRRRHAAIESLNESLCIANVYLVYSHRLLTGFMAVAISVSHTTMEIIIYGTVLVVGPKTLAGVKRTYKSRTMVLIIILNRDFC